MVLSIMAKTKSSTTHIIFAALIGHILEFFDFTMYMVFAVQIGKEFFPNESAFAQTLSSLAVFAVGFLMRPIGGIYFGHIGDTYGRKKALTISVVGMAVITFCMALLPNYHSIGILAPLLLVLCRLGQGFCVGGEGTGAAVFMLEHMHKLKPGLVGGIVNAGLNIGILLAMVTGMYLNARFGVDSNAWRYAFFIGGILGLVGVYIRMVVQETPIFENVLKSKKTIAYPIKKVLSSGKKNVALAIVYAGFFGVSGYLVVAFMNIFFRTVMMNDANIALQYAAFGSICLIMVIPMFGALSDIVGYTKTLVVACFCVLLTSIPIFELLSSSDSFSIYLGIFLLAALSASIHAPIYPFMLRIFSPEQRYTGIAFCMNLGVAMFGGTCSMICLWLIQETGSTFAPAYYWSAMSAATLMMLMATRPRIVYSKDGAMQY